MRLGRLLEPGLAQPQRLGVRAPIDELKQRLDRAPDRHVDEHPRVREGLQAGRVAAFVLEPPDEARGRVGEGVDPLETPDEARHPKIVEGMQHARDVDLGEVVAIGVGHGPGTLDGGLRRGNA